MGGGVCLFNCPDMSYSKGAAMWGANLENFLSSVDPATSRAFQ